MSSQFSVRGESETGRYFIKAAYILTALLLGIATLSAADYFPTDTGTTWVFNYEEWFGHSGGGTSLFGLKHWKIIDKQISNQGLVTFIVLERTKLNRKKYLGLGVTPFDSVFTEPRVSCDTIVFEDNGNLIYNERDQFFIHDPQGPTAAVICVRDSATEVFGETENTVLVIEGPCDLSPDSNGAGTVKHETFNYYFLKDGVGPVVYIFDSHGTRKLDGGHSWAKWTLRDPNVPIHYRGNRGCYENQLQWGTTWRGDALYLLGTQERMKSGPCAWMLFSLQGKVLSSGITGLGGETKIVLPDAVPVSSQFIVLKVLFRGQSVFIPVLYNR